MSWEDKVMILMVIVYMAIGIFTLSDYTITNDEDDNFYMGRSRLNYYLTGDRKYLEFADPAIYLPFANIFAAITHTLFSPVLGYVESFNLATFLFAILGVVACYLMGSAAHSKKAGLIIMIMLILFPRFFGHAHNNIKDVPLASLFMLALFTFWKAAETKKFRWITASAIVTACAVATKVNADFLLIIFPLWFIVRNYKDFLKILEDKSNFVKVMGANIKMFTWPVIFAIVLFLLLPWYWEDTFNRGMSYINHWTKQVSGATVKFLGESYVSGDTLPRTYFIFSLFLTTPLMYIIFFIIGLDYMIFGIKKNSAYSLLLIAFAVVVGKFFVLGTIQHLIRHGFEAIPILCCIAGIGVVSFGNMLKKRFKLSEKIYYGIFLALCAMVLVQMILIHPYQSVFFSEVFGMEWGRENFDFDYWCNSYRYAAEWINENAEQDAVVYSPNCMQHLPFYLRNDIKINHAFEISGNYLMLNEKSDELIDRIISSGVNPVYQVDVRGIPIVYIFNAVPNYELLEFFERGEVVTSDNQTIRVAVIKGNTTSLPDKYLGYDIETDDGMVYAQVSPYYLLEGSCIEFSAIPVDQSWFKWPEWRNDLDEMYLHQGWFRRCSELN